MQLGNQVSSWGGGLLELLWGPVGTLWMLMQVLPGETEAERGWVGTITTSANVPVFAPIVYVALLSWF